jgi:hypothetical protein
MFRGGLDILNRHRRKIVAPDVRIDDREGLKLEAQ